MQGNAKVRHSQALNGQLATQHIQQAPLALQLAYTNIRSIEGKLEPADMNASRQGAAKRFELRLRQGQLQQPVGAAPGIQQQVEGEDQQQGQPGEHHQGARCPAPGAAHRSGPMERWKRKPPSLRGKAKSTRIGPMGDSQRTPTPALCWRVKSVVLKALPAS